MKPNLRSGYITFYRKDNKKIKISYISILLIIVAMLMLIPMLESTIFNILDYSKINNIIKLSDIDIKIEKSNIKPELYIEEEEIEEDIKPIDDGKKYVALTFDDGPGKYTKELVDLLLKNNVKASFFMVGQNIKNYKSYVKYAYDNGMEICNHSQNHKNLKNLSKDEILDEINSVDDMLEKITGQKPKYYRSPGGNQNDTVLSTIPKPCILWNVDTRDWESRDTQKIIDKTLKEVDDGDIILMHEIYKTTLDAVEPIIVKLKEKGYNFVTVTELYQIKGVPLENGKVYYGM